MRKLEIIKLSQTEASTLAGEEKFGAANMETTDMMIEETDCVGNQRSEANSPLITSSPGGCKMEIHTFPSLKTERNKLRMPETKSEYHLDARNY